MVVVAFTRALFHVERVEFVKSHSRSSDICNVFYAIRTDGNSNTRKVSINVTRHTPYTCNVSPTANQSYDSLLVIKKNSQFFAFCFEIFQNKILEMTV